MLERIRERIRKQGGIARTLDYYGTRVSDELYIRRFGLRPAASLTLPRYSPAEIGFENTDENHVHIATALDVIGVLRRAMDRHVKPTRSDVLLDYGSGLGGALLIAATYPFGRIIGLEYSADLSARSAKVVALARPRAACKQVDLCVGDARQFELPDDVSVIYFFNAFSGAVLGDALERVQDSLCRRPREIRMVCLNPGGFDEHVRSNQMSSWIRLVGTISFPETFPQDIGYPMNVYVLSRKRGSARAQVGARTSKGLPHPTQIESP